MKLRLDRLGLCGLRLKVALLILSTLAWVWSFFDRLLTGIRVLGRAEPKAG